MVTEPTNAVRSLISRLSSSSLVNTSYYHIEVISVFETMVEMGKLEKLCEELFKIKVSR